MNSNNGIVYLDNAATTWPKPPEVVDAVNHYFNFPLGSPNRTNHLDGDIVSKIRVKGSSYFGVNEANCLIFVPSATIGMNIILSSLLHDGGHVVTTNCEHHSVYRPLIELEKGNIEHTIAMTINSDQEEDYDAIEKAIKNNTKMVIINHASNVTGTVFEVKKHIRNLQNRGILIVLDVSQTAGFIDIDMYEMGVDIIVASAHKHMYGIQGLGFIVHKPSVFLEPLYFGGTGKQSASMAQPDVYPDKLEAGSVNLPALLAFNAALDFCDRKKREKFRSHSNQLLTYFVDECRKNNRIRLYFREDRPNAGIISFNCMDFDPNFVVSPFLSSQGIQIRSGLHCAPMIHRTLGTFPHGTNRLSVSLFNTEFDLERVLECLVKL